MRNYNEDTISIQSPLRLPESMISDPECSYIGLFDGHAGKACATFLEENFHVFLANQPDLLTDPRSALTTAFEEAEQAFL